MPKSLFRHAKVTDALERVFRHVLTLPEQPAHTDDAAEWLEEADLTTLEMLCEGLTWEGDLRDRLDDDLTELELEIGDDNCGWLIELLGEGTVDYGEKEVVPTAKKIG